MSRVYLMQRFDLNEGFPRSSPSGIEPYIGASFVLFDEQANMIPLSRGWGHANGLSSRIVSGLKGLQDRGYEIRGSVHPFFREVTAIDEDLEIYQSFPSDSADYTLLREAGVNVVYEPAA